MINSLDGPVLLRDAFGALLAFNLGLMLKYVERPKVCGDKVEYGVPFFDDLDVIEKAVSLHALASAMFTHESPIAIETAYHAAALTALENYVKDGIEREITMRHWSKDKYGREDKLLRLLTIIAFQSRFPLIPCPGADSIETRTFVNMINRLFAEIRPRSYFLLADVPEEKRTDLMKRSSVPDDYFDPLEDLEKKSEEDRRELQRSLLADAMNQCESMLNFWAQTDRSELVPLVVEEFGLKKQADAAQGKNG